MRRALSSISAWGRQHGDVHRSTIAWLAAPCGVVSLALLLLPPVAYIHACCKACQQDCNASASNRCDQCRRLLSVWI
jgi:hypothetical protein